MENLENRAGLQRAHVGSQPAGRDGANSAEWEEGCFSNLEMYYSRFKTFIKILKIGSNNVDSKFCYLGRMHIRILSS
jgi:hypothetical protein